MCVFFAVLYLPQDGGGELSCSNGGGDPLHGLLEGAYTAIMELGEHLDTFFQCQLLKIAAALAAWVTAWQKISSVQTCWVF
jgi:hypothetical protein